MCIDTIRGLTAGIHIRYNHISPYGSKRAIQKSQNISLRIFKARNSGVRYVFHALPPGLFSLHTVLPPASNLVHSAAPWSEYGPATFCIRRSVRNTERVPWMETQWRHNVDSFPDPDYVVCLPGGTSGLSYFVNRLVKIENRQIPVRSYCIHSPRLWQDK